MSDKFISSSQIRPLNRWFSIAFALLSAVMCTLTLMILHFVKLSSWWSGFITFYNSGGTWLWIFALFFLTFYWGVNVIWKFVFKGLKLSGKSLAILFVKLLVAIVSAVSLLVLYFLIAIGDERGLAVGAAVMGLMFFIISFTPILFVFSLLILSILFCFLRLNKAHVFVFFIALCNIVLLLVCLVFYGSEFFKLFSI